jgi:hypothetical protein
LAVIVVELAVMNRVMRGSVQERVLGHVESETLVSE